MSRSKMKYLFSSSSQGSCSSSALLLLRLVAGTAFLYHGWGKIQNPFGWMGPSAPVPGFLQMLAAVSEFGGGIAWVLGLLTPLASVGLAITMSVAVLMHMLVMKDPFVATKGGSSYELAAVYLSISLVLLSVGPGKYSIDSRFCQKHKEPSPTS